VRNNVITINQSQDATQPAQFPNAVGVNLPNGDASVEDLNRAVSGPVSNVIVGSGKEAT
jgi:hypothetical protein